MPGHPRSTSLSTGSAEDTSSADSRTSTTSPPDSPRCNKEMQITTTIEYSSPTGEPRRPERGPGGLGALRPRHLPGPGPGGGDRGQLGVAESVKQPPTGGVRGHRPEQGGLPGQDRDVADRLGAVG